MQNGTREAEIGQDQPLVGVDEPERRHHGEERDEQERRRHQVGEHQPARDQSPAPGSGAGRARTPPGSRTRARRSVVATAMMVALLDVLHERRLREQEAVGVQRRVTRHQRRLEAVDLLVLLERGGDHPVEGHERPDQHDDEEAVADPPEQTLRAGLGPHPAYSSVWPKHAARQEDDEHDQDGKEHEGHGRPHPEPQGPERGREGKMREDLGPARRAALREDVDELEVRGGPDRREHHRRQEDRA